MKTFLMSLYCDHGREQVSTSASIACNPILGSRDLAKEYLRASEIVACNPISRSRGLRRKRISAQENVACNPILCRNISANQISAVNMTLYDLKEFRALLQKSRF